MVTTNATHLQYSEEEILAAINKNLGEIAGSMGIEFNGVGDDWASASLPVPGNRQPYGLLHGGASALLAETMGSVLCGLVAPTGKVPVGIELSCTHHRSVKDGFVMGKATLVNRGGTLATVDIRIVDEQERAICTSRLTCLFREPPADLADFREPQP
jgi:1,4-dihydroxy-2-naphthoyl-CoA hydrolase